MKQIKFVILAFLVLSLFLLVGCAPKGAMSNLMKEKGYAEQPQDPFDRSSMLSLQSIETGKNFDPNYAWQTTIKPAPGEFADYSKKIVTWRIEGKSYFNSLEEFEEASKLIHTQVQTNLKNRGIELADNQSLYYYTIKSFEFDKDELTSNMGLIMKSVVDEAKDKNITPVLLVGYADEVGTNNYNIVLSKKRAQVLKNEFKKLGLSSNNLEILAGGETTDYGSHAENRRGVLVCIVE